jgi:hypothetical protein
MKIAYLITVHKNPKLLARAISILSSPDSMFFIHIDQKADIRDFSAIAGDNIVLVPRRDIRWGEFSQVEATLCLLREALSSPVQYGYFCFLQGSDYPLRSASYIAQFLEAHQGCEFINLRRMPAPGYPLTKINTIRYPSDKPVRRFLMRVLGKFSLSERDYRKFLPGLEAYAGQAYWTLSRGACEWVMDFVNLNPHVEKYFRYAFTSDEMFFHTVLGNSPFRPNVRKSLMFVDPDWSVTGETRHQIGNEHIKFFELQDKIWVDDEWGSGEVLFARKLADDRLDLVERIDLMINRREAKHAAT